MKTDNSPLADDMMQKRLWDYIDGLTNQNESMAIQKLVAENAEWRTLYHELLEVHMAISATELESPSMRFSKNVMDEIAKNHIAPATKNYIDNKIIWSISFFFITLILGFVIYCFGQIDWASGNTTATGINLPTIDYSKIFNNTFVNIFMMLNIILGLLFLDRYLNKNKKQFQRH